MRLWLLWIGLVALFAFARPAPWSIALGLPFVIAGEALRIWAAGHLTKSVELVTSGPYAYTRNPLYLGRLAIFTGLCSMAVLPHGAQWLVLLAGIALFFGDYLPRKERVEPERLRQIHGDAYVRYRDAVPALFPTARRYAGSSGRYWSAARCLGNREPWMVIGLTLAVAWLAWRA